MFIEERGFVSGLFCPNNVVNKWSKIEESMILYTRDQFGNVSVGLFGNGGLLWVYLAQIMSSTCGQR